MQEWIIGIEVRDLMLARFAEIAAASGDRLLAIGRGLPPHPGYEVIDLDVREAADDLADLVRERAGHPAAVFTTQEMFITQATSLAGDLGVLRNPPEIGTIARDKALMKRIWQDADVRTARGWFFRSAREAESAAESFTYPLIVKPTHGYASCGVRKVCALPELSRQVRKIGLINSTLIARERQANTGVLVEEFLDGPEYAVDTVWFDGDPVADGILSRDSDMPGPYYPDRLYMLSHDLAQEGRAELLAVTHAAVRALGIRYGATHTELRVVGDRAYVLECASRPGANGMFYDLLEKAYGFDFTKAFYLSQVCRNRAEFETRLGPQHWREPEADVTYFWYCIPHDGHGVIEEITGLEELAARPEILTCICYKKPGGILYADVDLNAEYFCSVTGRYVTTPQGPSLEEYVRQYDAMVDVTFA